MSLEDTAEHPLMEKPRRISRDSGDSEETFIEDEFDVSTRRRGVIVNTGSRRLMLLAVAGYVLLVLTNLFTLWQWKRVATEACIRPKLTYTPAKSAIKYERKTLYRFITGGNVYTGEPRPELDQAWHDLIDPMVIKISEEELKKERGNLDCTRGWIGIYCGDGSLP